MAVFGRRRHFVLNEMPTPVVIRFMWEQGIILVIEKGEFFWMERKTGDSC